MKNVILPYNFINILAFTKFLLMGLVAMSLMD